MFCFVAAVWNVGLGAGTGVLRGNMSKIVGEEDQGLQRVQFNDLIHNVYEVVTLPEKHNVVLLLKYLHTCDHFVKVCIKRLKLQIEQLINEVQIDRYRTRTVY